MGTYHIWTVGCQVNFADSGKLAAGLNRLGWQPTDHPADADLVVLNTCAVRQHAEDKAASKLGALRSLKAGHPERKIAVMGCMVGPRPDAFQQRFPWVDVFAQPQRFADVLAVLDLPDEDLGGEFWPAVFPNESRPTAFVPVVEGCDKFCTYCIVPLRRGRERSRPLAEIVREVTAHTERGVREITLLGQTVEAYGKDQPPVIPGTDHADLSDLMAALHDLPGLRRIRQLTSYPPDMTDRILAGMASLPKVCEAFSLPVQSGDDTVLGKMRRGYTVAEFRERVEKVRALLPEVGISTDVIVGFPGETADQFRNTLGLLEDLRFDKVHVAAYSPRPGTYADRKQPDDVPLPEKMARLHAVEELQGRIAAEINAGLLGRTLDVLVEDAKPATAAGPLRLTGRRRTNKLVHFDAPAGAFPLGAEAPVRVIQTGPWSLQGIVAADGVAGRPATARPVTVRTVVAAPHAPPHV